jgi:hypothetical protein
MAKLNTSLLPVSVHSESNEPTIGETIKNNFPDVSDEQIEKACESVSKDFAVEKEFELQPSPINEEFLTDEIFEDVDDEDEQPVSRPEEVRGSGSDSESSNEGISGSAGSASEVSQSEPATDSIIEPEQVVEIQWDEEAEKRKDETAFFARLKELNEAIDYAKETLNEAKEEAKLAKDTLSVAVAQLQNFASKGVQYRKKPVPKPAVDLAKQASKSEPANTNEPRPEQIPESEWRSWETATILEGIEGLGAKKRDALIEHFPTFGKLMDARTESTKEHVSFHSLLPKGIGESIGTELINRMDAKIVPGM